MIHLYYYKALEERTLYDDNRFHKSLQNIFAFLNVTDRNEVKTKYANLVYKQFNLNESDLIEYK